MLIPGLLLLAVLVAAVHLLLRPRFFATSLLIGSALYLSYSITSRTLITRLHKRGIKLSKDGDYETAIAQYKRSYDFLVRHPWIDRYRSIVFLNASAISYREMALVNIAFCYSQLGDSDSCRAYYEKALREFPDSSIAKMSLRAISTFEGKN